MKSIQVIVPRDLVIKFLPHPEVWGDFVVTLENEMYTDVYYREEGHFFTITNDKSLIKYLKSKEVKPLSYIFRNGIFAYKEIKEKDKTRLKKWKNKDSIKLMDKITVNDSTLRTLNKIPQRMIVLFKWIEVGVVDIKVNNKQIIICLKVYDTDIIDLSHIEVSLKVFKQYFLSITS